MLDTQKYYCQGAPDGQGRNVCQESTTIKPVCAGLQVLPASRAWMLHDRLMHRCQRSIACQRKATPTCFGSAETRSLSAIV
jgi:hypothetical protein